MRIAEEEINETMKENKLHWNGCRHQAIMARLEMIFIFHPNLRQLLKDNYAIVSVEESGKFDARRKRNFIFTLHLTDVSTNLGSSIR